MQPNNSLERLKNERVVLMFLSQIPLLAFTERFCVRYPKKVVIRIKNVQFIAIAANGN